MKNKRLVLVVFISFPLIFSSIVIYNFLFVLPKEVDLSQAFNNWYLESFNYSFTGIITSYTEIQKERGNQYAIVDLDLISTDISDYPPDTATTYFCRISGYKARVMIPILHNVSRLSNRKQNIVRISDTLSFDGALDKFTLYSRGRTLSFTPLSSYPDLDFRERRNFDLK